MENNTKKVRANKGQPLMWLNFFPFGLKLLKVKQSLVEIMYGHVYLSRKKWSSFGTHFEPIKNQNFFLITLNKGHLPTEVNIMFASISFDL